MIALTTRAASRASRPSSGALRQFSGAAMRSQEQQQAAPTPAPAPTVKPKRKVGAFRGGLLGFLAGASITGYGAYYYLFDEYRAANNIVLSDVMQLQDSIRNLESHVTDLEKKVDTNGKKD